MQVFESKAFRESTYVRQILEEKAGLKPYALLRVIIILSSIGRKIRLRMGTYSIKDLENITGIKAHTLRIWEQRYGILRPERTETNIRRYCDEELKLLLNVSLLNKKGLKISGIARMTSAEICSKVRELSEAEADDKDYSRALLTAMLELSEREFECILDALIVKRDFEDVMLRVVYPFFHEVGVLWQAGSINAAHEHFISHLIRQKLIVSLHQLPIPSEKSSPKWLLFLPEGEMHEIALLFAYYILKKRGNKVIYLGQNLPCGDLEECCTLYKPDFLFTIITSSPMGSEAEKYVRKVAQAYKCGNILVSGIQLAEADFSDLGHVRFIESPQSLLRHFV